MHGEHRLDGKGYPLPEVDERATGHRVGASEREAPSMTV